MQVCPAAQARPHAPQFDVLVCRSTHAPEHAVCPAGQVVAQAPITQLCPAAQARPHAPQFSESDWVLVQLDPHRDDPAAQAQVPIVQDCPAAQTRPQRPQLPGSLSVLTQEPPQFIVPIGHMPRTQSPAEQTVPTGQTLPHRPQ
jgi:hypothetical protein